jgi:serine/threonine protein phosphatase PrpC
MQKETNANAGANAPNDNTQGVNAQSDNSQSVNAQGVDIASINANAGDSSPAPAGAAQAATAPGIPGQGASVGDGSTQEQAVPVSADAAPPHLTADAPIYEVQMTGDIPAEQTPAVSTPAPATLGSGTTGLGTSAADTTTGAATGTTVPAIITAAQAASAEPAVPADDNDAEVWTSATPAATVLSASEVEVTESEGANSASAVIPAMPDNATSAAPVPESDELSESAVAVAPDIPSVTPPAPPRPLVAGAFLRGEFEVKEVLSRGMTNLYRALGGDYGAAEPKLIAERDVESAQANSGPTTGNESTAQEVGSVSVEEALAAVAIEPVATDTPTETATTTTPQTPASSWDQSTLVPPHESFVQDDREYHVFEWTDSTSLQDWREPTNDERLLAMLHPLSHFLDVLEARNEIADLSTETVRVADDGSLRFFGFTSPRTASTPSGLEELREITNFLLKHVFAESATMRLDDRYAGMALSEEVKDWARRLDGDEGDFSSIAEATAALDAIYTPTRLRAESALLTDVGRERELNEDAGMIVLYQRAAHLDSRDMELYVVSDGMGGHEGGEVASDLTLSSLQQHLGSLDIDWNDNVAVRQALVDVMDAVNADVVALTETPKYKGTRAKPGATLVFALRQGARVWVGNVGDSRAFKYNEFGLQRISKDHSYVQNLVDRGDITDDEAWGHPEGSIITAHIGYPKLKTRDVFLRLFKPGDTLLLVSDGVIDMLRDREIEPYVREGDPDTVVRNLVDASNEAGGADNITAVCVRFS